MVEQPYQKDGCILLFNGEIYNWKDFGFNVNNDTECIIPLYRKYGFTFTKYLDGEYSIVIHDKANNLLIATTDAFMTKPLFSTWNRDTDELGFASYKSALENVSQDVRMAEPNTTIVWDLNTKKIVHTHRIIDWDLCPKNRTEMEAMAAWEIAFESAVKKRALHGGKMFLPLSSGYDSGCIALALERLDIKYDTFSTSGRENIDVLRQRLKRGKIHGTLENVFFTKGLSAHDTLMSRIIAERCEPWTYVHDDGIGRPLFMYEDGGAKALCYICIQMSELKYRVLLSGSGADELYSDYGFQGVKLYHHSQFGGLWPEDLTTIFPWNKFYDDTQRSYLFKDDFITGGFSIEGRYPFLDPEVVQEWLWMPSSMKNKGYKYPLSYYLQKYGYPYDAYQKIGFSL
jgi:asparagine synthetase B (glutamine-hydrolysing)